MSLQRLAQHTTLMITLAIEVDVEYGILQPLLFEIHDLKTLKEVAATFEIGFQSADEQALSETARPAEEESTSLSQPIYRVGLIHIDVAALADLLKTLYAYRIPHSFNSSFLLTNCLTLREQGCYLSSYTSSFLHLFILPHKGSDPLWTLITTNNNIIKVQTF